jgi:hypothetical protein
MFDGAITSVGPQKAVSIQTDLDGERQAALRLNWLEAECEHPRVVLGLDPALVQPGSEQRQLLEG